MGKLICSYWVIYLLIMLVLHACNDCGGLANSEQLAPVNSVSTLDVLLAFRNAITADPTQALASWANTTAASSNSSSGGANYCSWNGLLCHPNTHQVKGIFLAERHLQGSITLMIGHLQHLSYLNLSFNRLSGSVPAEVGSCTALLELALSDNLLEGVLPVEFNNLTRLQILEAGGNVLTGTLPRLVLPALQELNLTTNSLQGEPAASLLPGCSGLRILILSKNHFEGALPDSIGNLSQLGYLELANNNFTSISPSIANCTRLYHLDLSVNRITGFVPASWFAGLSRLSFLKLGSNQFTGTLPSNIGTLSQLQSIDVEVNNFQGQILQYVLNCSSLTVIHLYTNNFTESIPAELGSSLPHLVHLNLVINHFYGPFPASLGNCSNLEELAIGINYGISGPFPKQITGLLKLQKIDLQHNKFRGELPPEIGNLSSSLAILILNDNNFTGSLPPQLGLLKNLQGVTFEFNQFSGSIPQELGNCSSLLHLIPKNNLLSGPIPSSLGRINILEWLELQQNQLSGSIPTSLSNCTKLNRLSLYSNRLEGNILQAAFPSMLQLDLSNNSFSGPIPLELIGSMIQVQNLDLSFNNLSGSVPASLALCAGLLYLNLSSNQLTGSIPSQLGTSLRSLQVLNLSQNSISGDIPSELANLTSLQTLDLSFNHLHGNIPDSFTALVNVSSLNLSYNSLEGAIPNGGPFLSFTADSFLGNPLLCGSLLHRPCPATRRKPSALTIGLVVAASVVLLLVLTSGIAVLAWWLKTGADVPDINSPFVRLTLKEIQEATNNFSQDNILGSGGTSIVYKGTTRDGRTLAFKKMLMPRSIMQAENSSFFAEIKSVGQVRHRNLVKLLGYYSDHIENDILILDYMPNGNLSSHLHQAVRPMRKESHEDGLHAGVSSGTSTSEHAMILNNMMAWKDRLEIAKGIAAGLAYLHHDCSPTPIIHLDIKPTNILLDVNMNARISDFGLARVMQEALSHVSTENLKGSLPYMAPEYASFGQITKKCDVYSYGILLMEIVTGISPTEELFGDGQTLNKWVRSKLRGDDKFAESFVGLCLGTHDYTNEERDQVTLLLNVAMLCTKENPNERLTMREVFEHLGCTPEKFQEPFQQTIEKLI